MFCLRFLIVIFLSFFDVLDIQQIVFYLNYRLYKQEGKEVFDTRHNVLGQMQVGRTPSPFDRNMGTKMAAKACNWLMQQLQNPDVFDNKSSTVMTKDKNTAVLLGLRSRSYEFQSVQDLKSETDFTYRRWKYRWWEQMRSILRILAQHDSTYISVSEDVGDKIKGVLE